MNVPLTNMHSTAVWRSLRVPFPQNKLIQVQQTYFEMNLNRIVNNDYFNRLLSKNQSKAELWNELVRLQTDEFKVVWLKLDYSSLLRQLIRE